MSLGKNKVLKITWWSGHSATSGNWTVNWFGRRGLLWHFTSLGTALRFLGTSHFSKFLRRWYLQGSTGFLRTGRRFGDGETFRQVSLIRHVDGLRVDSNTWWLLTASQVSSISPEDLSIFSPYFVGSLTTRLDTQSLGSSSLFITLAFSRRASSSFSLSFRATGTRRGGMVEGEALSSTSR